MRRTPVCLLASLMATVAFGLDLRLVSPATVEVTDGAGNGLISFNGVNLRYPKSQFFKNGTATAVAGGFEIAYDPPAAFPVEYTLPRVTGRFVKRGDDVVVSYRLSGVTAADSFSEKLSMIGRQLGTGVKRVDSLSKAGRWVRDPNGGQPTEEPLGLVVSYASDVSGFISVHVRGQEPNLDWQDPWQAHINFVSGEADGEWRTGFTLCDRGRSAFAMANAAVGRCSAVSISTPRLYSIFDDGKPLEFTAKAENATDGERSFELSWWVRDFGGRTVASGRRSVTLGPYGCEPVAVTFDPDEDRGLYFAEVSAVDVRTGEEAFARTNLARLPPYEFSSTPETSPFGIAAYWPIPDEESVQKLMDRMGVRWVRGGDTRLQHPPRRANRHSSANVQTLKGEERTAWIEAELATCRACGNAYWEFGNEFNMSTAGIALEGGGIGQALLCEDYVDFVREIVRVKQTKGYGDVHLLSLGLAGHDAAFIRGIWERGAWGLLEGFCLHPGRGNFTADYPYMKPERVRGASLLTAEDGTEKLKNPNFWSFLGAVRATERQIATYGDMPLWLTEVYTPTYPNDSWNDTLRASAENTMLTYALVKADGAKCAFYYQLFDSVWYDRLGANPREREYFFGLLNRDLSPKPAFMAYVAIAEELDGADCLGWVRMKNGTSHALLFAKGGSSFLVAWDRTEGYVLTHNPPNGQKYCSTEPWEEHWTTMVEVEIPVVQGPQTVNAIGQAHPLAADRFGIARVGLTGAPVIVRNVDRARLEIVGSPALDVFPDREKLVVHAPMDERGERPPVRDQSGADRTAQSAGNVTGGRTSNAACLQGFTSTQSQVVFTNVVENWSRNWSFVCWVRNPDLAASGVRLIARGGGNASHPDGSGSDNGWQVWIDADGRVRIGFQNWNGGQAASESDASPVDWKQDVWYQVAVIFSFRTVGDMRYKTASAYVTAAGSAAIGPPVAVLTMDSAPGLGVSKNLIIGAAGKGYYGTAMPSGCFAGDICQAWLFLKTLTADELLSDVRAFRCRHHAIEDFAKLYWKLDETGVTPTAKDATGNGFDGVSAGGVSGGLDAPRGTSYGGFSSLGSDLCATLDSAQYFQNGNRNDVVLWVKRPQPTVSSTALLAGNMKVHADPGSSQPWRVYVTDTGAVGVSMQSWNGFVSKTVGEPYDWGDAWHLVVIRFDRPKMSVPEGQSVCNRIRVSAAPATRAGVRNDFRLLVEGVQLKNNSLLESGANLVFGSAGSGYYREFQPKSVLGAGGRIGEVAVAIGGWFDWDWLSAQLTRYCGPGEGLSVILK